MGTLVCWDEAGLVQKNCESRPGSFETRLVAVSPLCLRIRQSSHQRLSALTPVAAPRQIPHSGCRHLILKEAALLRYQGGHLELFQNITGCRRQRDTVDWCF